MKAGASDGYPPGYDGDLLRLVEGCIETVDALYRNTAGRDQELRALSPDRSEPAWMPHRAEAVSNA